MSEHEPLGDCVGQGPSTGTLEDAQARLELSLMTEPGDPRLAALVEALGAVQTRHVVLEGHSALGDAGQRWGIRLREHAIPLAVQLLERHPVSRSGTDRVVMRWVCPGSPEWAVQLEDLSHVDALQRIAGPPLGLWVRGPLDLTVAADSVAIVGARAATSYGEQVAGDLAAHCVSHGFGVVSGAAFGIDAAAHRGAMAMGGATVAVLASGADVAYPRAHTAMLDRIGETGLVLSEVAPGSTPTKMRFLARNRLIAALSRGAVIVEAAHRSGALNTLNWAGRLGRVTMGVPGPVTSSSSAGVHQLLREGGSVLVTRGDELLEAVGAIGRHPAEVRRGPERVLDPLAHDAQAVLEVLQPRASLGVATVATRAELGVQEALRTLSGLLASGLAERTDDGWRLTRSAHERLRRPRGDRDGAPT
ncbi:MAG: DNA-processing protein DprA [Actinomycetota bacterium]|nr:DNA-processing protein DprA [Actinomycetota bacterium]